MAGFHAPRCAIHTRPSKLKRPRDIKENAYQIVQKSIAEHVDEANQVLELVGRAESFARAGSRHPETHRWSRAARHSCRDRFRYRRPCSLCPGKWSSCRFRKRAIVRHHRNANATRRHDNDIGMRSRPLAPNSAPPEALRRLHRLHARGLLSDTEYHAALAAVQGYGTQPEGVYRCSFCSKTKEQVQRLIAGPGRVYICDECIGRCQSLTADDPTYQPPPASEEVDCTFCDNLMLLLDCEGFICRSCLDTIGEGQAEWEQVRPFQ